MKACVHVDYLSYEWQASDVIRTYIETRNEIRQVNSKLRCADDAKEKKSLRLEHQRLARYQNALWRQMSRTCTSQLGRSNQLVHPSTVNWQKESDITWLYGPLYLQEADSAAVVEKTGGSYDNNHGLKPALKKPCSTSTDTTITNALTIWMRRTGSCAGPLFDTTQCRALSFSSVSSGETLVNPPSSNNVRFSPEISKVQYFMPESPVCDSLGNNPDDVYNPYFAAYYYNNEPVRYYIDDEDEDDDDGPLWELMQHVASKVRTTASRWLIRWTDNNQSDVVRLALQQQQHQRDATTSDVILTFVSVVKSVASLTATWLMYQGLLRLLWVIHRPRLYNQARRKANNNNQHETPRRNHPIPSFFFFTRQRRHNDEQQSSSSKSTL